MTLLEEINEKCSPELVASRDYTAIATLVSTGRTKPSEREIGNGTILELVGLTYGNSLLDVIYTNPDFRYVKPLLEQGRLVAGSPLVVNSIKAFNVMGLLPEAQTKAILAITTEPAPVSANDVRLAMDLGVEPINDKDVSTKTAFGLIVGDSVKVLPPFGDSVTEHVITDIHFYEDGQCSFELGSLGSFSVEF